MGQDPRCIQATHHGKATKTAQRLHSLLFPFISSRLTRIGFETNRICFRSKQHTAQVESAVSTIDGIEFHGAPSGFSTLYPFRKIPSIHHYA